MNGLVRISRSKAVIALLAAAAMATPEADAGDAVVIGYNTDGVWTSVIYYCSGTPKGGADYKDEARARAAAVADLKKRAGEGVVTTKVLAASDRTGHFAYARGKNRAGEDLHSVGYGASKETAEADAIGQLQQSGVPGKGKVIYNYFSHGSAPAVAPRAKGQ